MLPDTEPSTGDPPPPDAQPSLYEDAAIYDILHTPGTADELTGLERAAAHAIGPAALAKRALWLEPACGTGRLPRLIARRGRRAIGFDRSHALIDYAAERVARLRLAGRARFFVDDMLTFASSWETRPAGPPRPIVAINTINTIRHLPTDEAVRTHLAHVARVLGPGGVYLIGISTTPHDWGQPTEDIWRARRGATRLTQIVQYEAPQPDPRGPGHLERVTSHLVITTARRGESRERHETSGYSLRSYSMEEWHALIESSAVRTVTTFDASGRPDDPTPLGYRLYALGPR